MGFAKTIREFPRTFWTANTMELFERWAWYGIFIILPLYLTGSIDDGALGFSQNQKGILMGTVTGILYFLPLFTGAIADRYGYKKVLVISYIILSIGYLSLGYVSSYTSVYLVFLFVALGAGLFKPVISATVAKTSEGKNSSLGFGIFYMIVNIGAFVGPIVASQSREISWKYPFMISAVAILINLILVLVFYKEPPREKDDTPLGASMIKILKNIWVAISDLKFLVFLIIIVGFWTMYNQLFFSLPVFIEQWVNTSAMYEAIHSFWPWLAEKAGTPQQTINPEMIVNIDALYIVLFQVLISSLIMKYKPINTIIAGFLISSIGIGLWFITQNGFYLFMTIFIFAIGEMSSSPRVIEYIGKIAPKDKVALYMGAYYLPFSIGNILAGIISGPVYEKISDKIELIKLEVADRGMQIPEISKTFTKNDFLEKASQMLDMNQAELTNYLWTNYHPYNFWIVVTGIGMLTTLSLFAYDRILRSKKG
ncbi:MAG: MFS transporter [Bacteroidales bacterium]|nr:MFS transporter [Bacteroidales bacterium]MCF8344576.1 MFS transporter [Bacteroidales bacterium]MCF8350683.1 MFS transporter [Bacteroidales bacterium]MCF8376976.1 MFS transporter [Bacteroidales bacterium]MCF8400871.1 MFS transporter [Bacteroidales bacterium]